MIYCEECEFSSTDDNDFVMVNVEAANYSMGDPYSGYGGDPMCKKCHNKYENYALEAEISSREWQAENPPDFYAGERYAH